MGAVATGASKLADANLNVVPSIDLMVCLICFLLVATTWSNLARIPTAQALPKSRSSVANLPEVQPELIVVIAGGSVTARMKDAGDALAVPVRVAPDGVELLCEAGSADRCANGDERYARIDRERLQAEMTRLVLAAGSGTRTKVKIGAADDVPYQHLIAVMDTVLQVCPEADGCLRNPTIADLSLLR